MVEMKKALRLTSLALITFLMLNIFTIINTEAASISKGNIITVDKNGDGDYTTIQEAINNAKSGSTIYVKNGKYPEILDIRKQIKLIGEDKESTIINPTYPRDGGY